MGMYKKSILLIFFATNIQNIFSLDPWRITLIDILILLAQEVSIKVERHRKNRKSLKAD